MKCKICNGDMKEQHDEDFFTVFWCPVCGTLLFFHDIRGLQEYDWHIPMKAMK